MEKSRIYINISTALAVVLFVKTNLDSNFLLLFASIYALAISMMYVIMDAFNEMNDYNKKIFKLKED